MYYSLKSDNCQDVAAPVRQKSNTGCTVCAGRQGLGTPGARAGMLQKLMLFGFLERNKCKKTIRLMSSHGAFPLITILAEQTAEGYTHDPKLMEKLKRLADK